MLYTSTRYQEINNKFIQNNLSDKTNNVASRLDEQRDQW